jgi:mycothiol synthase
MPLTAHVSSSSTTKPMSRHTSGGSARNKLATVGIGDHGMPMEPEPFDLLSASLPDAVARHELFAAVKAEFDPGDPVPSLDALRSMAAHLPAFQRQRQWVVRDGGGIVGWAQLEILDTVSNRTLGDFRIEVLPTHRRRGIGATLLDVLAEAAISEGRTTLGCQARTGSPGEAFLHSRGAQMRSPFRHSRLTVAAVDRAMLTGWAERAAERAADYSLVGWDDPCPEEHLERFTEVVHVMNTAPLDDLEREDDVWTVEQIRAWQSSLEQRGHAGWTLCARHDPSGRFVGFTELGFWPWTPVLAFQGDTGVHPDHRNRGLGRWLKATMLLRLMTERPEVQSVDTGNASSNRAMLAINEAMGFRPHRTGGFWQLKL